jgi:hypothetical protein
VVEDGELVGDGREQVRLERPVGGVVAPDGSGECETWRGVPDEYG